MFLLLSTRDTPELKGGCSRPLTTERIFVFSFPGFVLAFLAAFFSQGLNAVMLMHAYTDVTHGDVAMQNINYEVTGQGEGAKYQATLIDLDNATFKNVREASRHISNLFCGASFCPPSNSAPN